MAKLLTVRLLQMRSVEGLSESEIATIVDSVHFNDDGLVPAIAQQFDLSLIHI